MGFPGQPNRFFQSAPCTIARNGVSNSLGGGEPEARHFLICHGFACRSSGSAPGLQHKAPGAPHAAISNAQEFSAFFQSSQWDEMSSGLHGIARAARLMPRGSYGPLHGAARELSCHSWLHCATGIRAAFCVPVRLVDMCVSRLNSMSLLWSRHCETKARNAALKRAPNYDHR